MSDLSLERRTARPHPPDRVYPDEPEIPAAYQRYQPSADQPPT